MALFIWLVVSALMAAANAQRCERLRSGSTCDGVLDYGASTSVFIPAGQCQDVIEQSTAQVFQGSLSILSVGCRDAVARYACARTYAKCARDPVSGAAVASATPVGPCAELCLRAAAACSANEKGLILPNVGISLPSECGGLPAAGSADVSGAATATCYYGVNASFVQRTSYARCEAYGVSGSYGVWANGGATAGAAPGALRTAPLPGVTLSSGVAGAAGSVAPSAGANAVESSFGVDVVSGDALQSGVCSGVVDYPVYVAAHTTQAGVEAALRESLPAVYIAPRGRCLTALLKWVCARAFLRCDTGVIARAMGVTGLESPFPRLPCASVCASFGAECDGFLRSQPLVAAALRLNCSGAASHGLYQPATWVCPANGGPYGNGSNSDGVAVRAAVGSAEAVATAAQGRDGADYPERESVWAEVPNPLGGGGVVRLTTACNSWYDAGLSAANGNVSTDRAVTPTVVCPAPLVVPDDPDFVNPIGGSCALPCPIPLFTRTEYHVMEQVFIPVAWVSIILNGFLLVSYVVIPERRKSGYVVFFLLSTWLAIAPFFLDVVPVGDMTRRLDGFADRSPQTIDRNTCKSNTEPLDESVDRFAYCQFAASMRLFFATGIYFWWLVQAFDLFMKVAFPFFKLPHYIGYVYHGVVWSVCASVLISVLATDAIGPIPAYPLCHVRDPTVDWYATYLPLGFAIGVGTVLVLAIVYFLFRSRRLTHTKDWSAQRTMLSILALFDIIWAIPLLYRVIAYYAEDEITASTTEWVTCLLSPGGSAVVCGEHPSVRPNRDLLTTVLFISAAVGIFAFLVYGLRIELYIDWLVFCKLRKPRATSAYETGHPSSTLGSGTGSPLGSSHIHSGAPGGAGGDTNKHHASGMLNRHGSTATLGGANKKGERGIRSGRTGSTHALLSPTGTKKVLPLSPTNGSLAHTPGSLPATGTSTIALVVPATPTAAAPAGAAAGGSPTNGAGATATPIAAGNLTAPPANGSASPTPTAGPHTRVLSGGGSSSTPHAVGSPIVGATALSRHQTFFA